MTVTQPQEHKCNERHRILRPPGSVAAQASGSKRKYMCACKEEGTYGCAGEGLKAIVQLLLFWVHDEPVSEAASLLAII
eukprot:1161662-Pelagomonas_calceolata.AAC.9